MKISAPSPRFGSLQLNRYINPQDNKRHYSVQIATGPIGREDRVYFNGLWVGTSATVKRLTQQSREHLRTLQPDAEVSQAILSFLANPADLDVSKAEDTTLKVLDNATGRDYFERHRARLLGLFKGNTAHPSKRTEAGQTVGLGLSVVVSPTDDI